MNTTDLLMRYSRIARPLMLPWMEPASCIPATRLTQMVLGMFGLRVTPVAMKLQVQCERHKCAYVSGLDPKELRRARAGAKKAKATWVDLKPSGTGYNGHVLGFVEGRWMVDASIDQASQPNKGFVIPPEALVLDLGEGGETRLIQAGGLHARFTLDDGTAFTIDYGPNGDTSFLETDAWRDEALPVLAFKIWSAMEETWRDCSR